jgi:hypothetical protein
MMFVISSDKEYVPEERLDGGKVYSNTSTLADKKTIVLMLPPSQPSDTGEARRFTLCVSKDSPRECRLTLKVDQIITAAEASSVSLSLARSTEIEVTENETAK